MISNQEKTPASSLQPLHSFLNRQKTPYRINRTLLNPNPLNAQHVRRARIITPGNHSRVLTPRHTLLGNLFLQLGKMLPRSAHNVAIAELARGANKPLPPRVGLLERGHVGERDVAHVDVEIHPHGG